jgi:tetrahydromethanopterin S-methyltransferase subunit G
MTGNLDQLPERVDRIERKLDSVSASVDSLSVTVDSVSASVDRRFEEVNKRFDEVNEHFVEQRQYTEFAFERLERRMVAGFEAQAQAGLVYSGRLDRLERKLDQFIDSVHSVTRPTRTRKKR